VYSLGIKGVMRVSASGGTPERLRAGKETELAYGPQVLPGGKSLLLTLAAGPSADAWDKARVVVQAIGGSEQKTIITGGSDARYLPTGHIVYALGGSLMAVPFDLGRLETTGGPVPVVDGVRRSVAGATGTSQSGISSNGSLVYIPGPTSLAAAQQDIGLMDRKGVVQPLKLPAALYEYPRASPDGKRIAFGTDDGKEANVWIYELDGRNSTRRLTFGGRNKFPIWSTDSRRVSFQSDRDGDLGIWWQAADGTGAAERLTKAEPATSHIPESWSPKSGALLYTVTDHTLRSTLWMLSVQERKVAPFGGVQSKGGNLIESAFSPNGQWVAYTTNETDNVGDNNVYVQPFPATGAIYQISKTGENGHDPAWSADGKELFYVPQVGQFVAVTVTTEPSFSFGNPMSVPRAFPVAGPTTPRTFDITPDGRILSIVAPGQTQPGSAVQQIQLVINWFEELKARVPTKQ
jgi:serine/threonine-protein kinase